MTKKWVEINDLSSGQYSANKNIWYIYCCKREVDLLAAAANKNDKAQKDAVFKNNAPFWSCISKINSTLIGNSEDLDMIISMYNLLECSQNYSMTGNLWNYYRYKIDDVDNASYGKSSNYKTKLAGKIPEKAAQQDPG